MEMGFAMTKSLTGSRTLWWTAVLGTSALFGSYAFACVFPFAALATVAALTLSVRRAAGLVALVWLVNQGVGFGLRDYPHTADTIAWGLVIGAGAFAALTVATLAVRRGAARLVSPGAGCALLGAFAMYEGVLFAYAAVLGDISAFTPRIVAGVAVNDLCWFAALAGLRLMIGATTPVAAGRRIAA